MFFEYNNHTLTLLSTTRLVIDNEWKLGVSNKLHLKMLCLESHPENVVLVKVMLNS